MDNKGEERLGKVAAEALVGLARAFGGEEVGGKEKWKVVEGEEEGEEGVTMENLRQVVNGVIASLRAGEYRYFLFFFCFIFIIIIIIIIIVVIVIIGFFFFFF